MLSWNNSKLIKKDAPGGKGTGTFVKDPIAKGEVVVVTGGRIMSNADINRPEFRAILHHAFQIDADFNICPMGDEPGHTDGIFAVNHSCEPSCGVRGQMELVALRDLRPGEEITYDYAMTDVDNDSMTCQEMKCLCGAKSCRGTITGRDWQNEELRRRYAGYFSTYVQSLIDAGKQDRRTRRR
jgi:SET domain-containing protein